MIESNEKLIAKIQLEYLEGTSIEIAKDLTEWDIGLLYFTNKCLWFINSEKERFQIDFADIIDIESVKDRTSKRRTKFTEVLKADYVMNIDFKTIIEDKPAIHTVKVSAEKGILRTLKNQLQVRLEKTPKVKKGTHKLDKNELMRRFAVLEQLQIEDRDMLKYFLGLDDRELVNIMLERNRILQTLT